jgi:predicted nucleic acid-binding protein
MELIWNAADDAVCVALGYVEGRAAIARRLPARARARARRLLDERWHGIETVEVDDGLIGVAVHTADLFRLGALDALHLAAAVQAGSDLTFVTWDERLANAARKAGFAPAPA